MSEKQEKKAEAAPAPAATEKKEEAKGGLMSKTPVLLGGVMIIEAVVLFAGIKFLGGGGSHPAQGAELTTTEGGEGAHGEEGEGHGAVDKRKTVEINVIDFKTPNRQTGRLFLYDVSIFVVTKGEFADKLKEIIKDREALIKDRIRTIIAQSDPEKLGGGGEPGLETLRRQVKYQLDEIIGEGMIEDVLIPRCTPFRVDF
ncbi:MAG: hypothetical protein IT447_03090 [Phycisphaerales bacterium]|nr:hypothetical protein [Phycisphaerales bacterium]